MPLYLACVLLLHMALTIVGLCRGCDAEYNAILDGVISTTACMHRPDWRWSAYKYAWMHCFKAPYTRMRVSVAGHGSYKAAGLKTMICKRRWHRCIVERPQLTEAHPHLRSCVELSWVFIRKKHSKFQAIQTADVLM